MPRQESSAARNTHTTMLMCACWCMHGFHRHHITTAYMARKVRAGTADLFGSNTP